MALDQAGKHGLARGVELRDVVVPLLDDLVAGTDGGDAAVADRDPSISHEIERPLLLAPTRAAAVDHSGQLGGVQDVEVGHGRAAGVAIGAVPPFAATVSPAYCFTSSAGPAKS